MGLTLYGRKTSINVQKAAWALREADVAFDWAGKEDKPGVLDTPEYRALNPQLRVPTLIDDGVIVRQSNVIVRHIARNYAVGNLWPEDAATLADAEYWMDWQASDNWRNLVAMFWNLIRVPPEERDDRAVAAGVAGIDGDLRYLDDQLMGKDFVTGSDFTMGDISVGAAVHRILALPIERPAAPNVDAYYTRLQERPAFRECVMVPMP